MPEWGIYCIPHSCFILHDSRFVISLRHQILPHCRIEQILIMLAEKSIGHVRSAFEHITSGMSFPKLGNVITLTANSYDTTIVRRGSGRWLGRRSWSRDGRGPSNR